MIAMHKLLSLPILAATLLLSGCEGTHSTSTAPASSEGTVAIAPRIVRSASISDSLWNATVTVFAGLYDVRDSLIPGTGRNAAFGSGRLTLPPVAESLLVSVYVSGLDASGTKIWSGWTPWQQAKSFKNGLQARTDIEVFSRVSTVPSPTTSLIGTWTMDSTYYVDQTFQVVLYYANYGLDIMEDGRYAIAVQYRFALTDAIYASAVQTGTWSGNATNLRIAPANEWVCDDSDNLRDLCANFPTNFTATTLSPNSDMTWTLNAKVLTLFDPSENITQYWTKSD